MDMSQTPPKSAPEKQTLRCRFLYKGFIKTSSQGRPIRKWGWPAG